jgi:hypothetical protein
MHGRLTATRPASSTPSIPPGIKKSAISKSIRPRVPGGSVERLSSAVSLENVKAAQASQNVIAKFQNHPIVIH